MISVAVPTLDRPGYVRGCLERLLDGDVLPSEILVIDQSAGDETAEVVAALGSDVIRLVRHSPPSASGARNHAVHLAGGDYVALLDDDVEIPPDWLRNVQEELRRFGGPDALYGDIRPSDPPSDRKALPVSTFAVDAPRVWTTPVAPDRLGFGGHMVVRQAAFLALGGFDERLGPGSPFFGAEDMDFNYRLMAAGYRAASSPNIWITHLQWRPQEEIPRLYYRYNIGFAGFCAKHLRARDWRVLRLFGRHLMGDARMLASAVRRRSGLRVRAAGYRSAGTWRGLAMGLRAFGGRPRG